MRGDDPRPESMFSYVTREQRVRADHPLRPIRRMTDALVSPTGAGVSGGQLVVEPLPPNGSIYAIAQQAYNPVWSRDGKEVLYQRRGQNEALQIVPGTGFAFREAPAISRGSLMRALVDQVDSCGVAPNGRALRGGRARGRLAGGNLALIASLMGTPWSIDFDGAILVLEDIDEAVYRVDRMMRQLLLAGALSRCVAIVSGDFRPPQGESADENRLLDDVLAEVADEAGIPCLAGAPFGHIHDQWTLPLGAMAEVDTDELSLRVVGG